MKKLKQIFIFTRISPLFYLFLIIFNLLCISIENTYASGPFGPPTPITNEKSNSGSDISLGYFYYQSKWKPDNIQDFTDIDFSQNMIFLQWGTLFSENSEGYIRIGGADFKETGAGSFSDNFKLFGSIGYKGLWYGGQGRKSSRLGIGPIIQASYYMKYSDDGSMGTIPISGEITNYFDVSLAIGFQGNIGDRFLIFGGPFGFYSYASAKLSSPQFPGQELSTNFKENNYLGGYAGIRFLPSKSFVIEVEGQYKSDFSLGATISYIY